MWFTHTLHPPFRVAVALTLELQMGSKVVEYQPAPVSY